MNDEEWMLAMASLVPALLVGLPGVLLLLVASDIGSDPSRPPSGGLRALATLGWIVIAVTRGRALRGK
jgi:hypothetical protein